MKDEPPLDTKCKDKFLVQTVAVTGDLEFANVTSIVCSASIYDEYPMVSNFMCSSKSRPSRLFKSARSG